MIEFSGSRLYTDDKILKENKQYFVSGSYVKNNWLTEEELKYNKGGYVTWNQKENKIECHPEYNNPKLNPFNN